MRKIVAYNPTKKAIDMNSLDVTNIPAVFTRCTQLPQYQRMASLWRVSCLLSWHFACRCHSRQSSTDSSLLNQNRHFFYQSLWLPADRRRPPCQSLWLSTPTAVHCPYQKQLDNSSTISAAAFPYSTRPGFTTNWAQSRQFRSFWHPGRRCRRSTGFPFL